MAEFYVETSPKDSGEHLVHRAECSSLPANKESIRYLGSIASSSSAVKKAAEWYKLVDGCSHCITAH